MVLSRRSITALLDLVEAKIDDMDIDDREAARDLRILQHCRTVLQRLGGPRGQPHAIIEALRHTTH